MKVDIKKLPQSEVELIITVPFDVYKDLENKALDELNKDTKVEGFRSGHIPTDVLKENLPPEKLMNKTLDILFPQTYVKAVQENNLQVISQPKVEIKQMVKKDGDDFIYSAVTAIMPEIKMGDYKSIKIEKPSVELVEKDIEDAKKMLMDRFAEWQNVEREAKNGDRVETDFEGFDEEGKSIPNTSSKNHPIILGSKTMIPGFEEAILNMKTGENKEFNITFPKEYHAKNMQGKKVKFKITVNRIEEKKKQELNEELIEKITNKKQSIKEFEELLRRDLKKEKEKSINHAHDNKVVAELIKLIDVEIPTILIDQELNSMLEEQKHHVSRQGLKWEDYLKHIKKTEDDFKTDHLKDARERVKARFAIQYVIKDAKIEASDEEVQKEINRIIETAKDEEHKKQITEYYKNEQAVHALKHNLAADKLMALLTK